MEPERLAEIEATINEIQAFEKHPTAICKIARELLVELKQARERCRTTTQVLIEEIGADGPKNSEDSAKEAVEVIRKLKAEKDQLRRALVDAIK